MAGKYHANWYSAYYTRIMGGLCHKCIIMISVWIDKKSPQAHWIDGFAVISYMKLHGDRYLHRSHGACCLACQPIWDCCYELAVGRLALGFVYCKAKHLVNELQISASKADSDCVSYWPFHTLRGCAVLVCYLRIDVLSDFYTAVGLHKWWIYIYRWAEISVSAQAKRDAELY